LYFTLLCNFLKLRQFKQIISRKFNIFKTYLITVEPEKALWDCDQFAFQKYIKEYKKEELCDQRRVANHLLPPSHCASPNHMGLAKSLFGVVILFHNQAPGGSPVQPMHVIFTHLSHETRNTYIQVGTQVYA
jgi:hypothetical protein